MINLRSPKSALLLGALNGVLFALAYQPVKTVYIKYLWSIKSDHYVYIAYPEIYRVAHDAGEFFVWTLLFAAASYTAHRLWATKLKSIVALWLRVAIVAAVVPFLGLWATHLFLFLLTLALKLLSACAAPVCDAPVTEIARRFMRESLDVQFELLLFAVALTLNLIYGTIIAKTSKLVFPNKSRIDEAQKAG